MWANIKTWYTCISTRTILRVFKKSIFIYCSFFTKISISVRDFLQSRSDILKTQVWLICLPFSLTRPLLAVALSNTTAISTIRCARRLVSRAVVELSYVLLYSSLLIPIWITPCLFCALLACLRWNLWKQYGFQASSIGIHKRNLTKDFRK